LSVALPILVLDELITTFQGGDTLIRRAIDGIFGKGTTQRLVEDTKEKFVELKDKLVELKDEITGALKTAFEGVKEALKENASALVILTGLWVAYKVAITTVTTAKKAYAATVVALTAIKNAYAAVITVTTGALALLRGATFASVAANVAAQASLAPLIVTLGAAAAAVGALIAVYNQWNKLSSETGGLGLTGIIKEMVKQGKLNPFEAVDSFQNDQARREASLRTAGGTVNGGNTTVNVTVPPGTPGQTATRVGQAAASAVNRTNRATLNAVAFQG